LEHVAWKNILAAGWPVLSVLLIGSITTFAVLFERWRTYSKIEPNSKPFLESVRKAADIQKIIAWCENSDQPLAQITAHIFKAAASRDDKERALQRSIQIQVQTLETHVSVLGTIASVAPFVGLLGTVIGIIRAFRAVSMSASGGATMVALGIAEALVGTAAGLIVAIPALLAYNFFVNKLRRLTQDWEIVGSELVDLSLKNSRG
jgi:biopolymer transport protein ExbB/TolQ